MRSGGLEVEQYRDLASQPIESIDVEFDSGATSHGCQVNQPIGRSADRLQDGHRVAHRRFGDQVAWPRRTADCHFGSTLAAGLGYTAAVCMGCRRSSAHWHCQAKRLDEAGHGACCSHYPASAHRWNQAAADQIDLSFVDHAGAILGPQSPAVCTGAKHFAPMMTHRHWPGLQNHNRQILAAAIT